MKTIILQEPGRFQTVDAQAPPPPEAGEALVQVRRIGICGTDYHAYQGHQTFFDYPRVIGHELGVEILSLRGEVPDLEVGDLCAVEPYINCGRCSPCLRGKTNCCVSLQVLGVHADGGMLGKLKLPVNKLHRSAGLSLDQLALVEMFSVGYHAVRRVQLEQDALTLVIGAGPIGLSVLESARLTGARCLLLEVNPRRVEFCRRELQLECVLSPHPEPLQQILQVNDGEFPAVVFDCTGSPASMMSAFALVGHGGRLVLVGHYPGDIRFENPLFHGREMTLLASRNATSEDFKAVIELMEQKRIDVSRWVTHRMGPEEVGDSFPRWMDPQSGVLKGVVDWEDPAASGSA